MQLACVSVTIHCKTWIVILIIIEGYIINYRVQSTALIMHDYDNNIIIMHEYEKSFQSFY